MDVRLEPGTYVVAVSGGVDSMVLLDILTRQAGLNLVVAHFDHGIRPDSEVDRRLVQATARRYGLPFVFDRAELGPDASEDRARKARYKFLRRVHEATNARAIVTAHHQDDAIETAIINLMRGTGRKGLSSLGNGRGIERPLLDITKEDILRYAKKHGIRWREDITNQDPKYLRNYLRQNVTGKLTESQRKELINTLKDLRSTNKYIDEELNALLTSLAQESRLSRQGFAGLPHEVATELLASWLRAHGIRRFDKKLLERLVVGMKTLAPGKKLDVDSGHQINIGKQYLKITARHTRNKGSHSV